MKKIVLTSILMIAALFAYAGVWGEADIKFEKTNHDFGTFFNNLFNLLISFSFSFSLNQSI